MNVEVRPDRAIAPLTHGDGDSLHEADRFFFASCEMRVLTREVWLGGVVRPTTRKIFDCLCFLIRHRDRVVSKEELVDRVWAGAVVSESVLARAIMKARRAIGDRAASPNVIKTIHGVGYRFIAEVTHTVNANTSVSKLHPHCAITTVESESQARDGYDGPLADSRQAFCEWAFQRGLSAAREDRWLIAAKLLALAVDLDAVQCMNSDPGLLPPDGGWPND